ncbi:hypothetical protein WN55_10776 [Dufourea novaeangliae]|uniref:Uncharacterized protein n=1 Tax=Dufourea novaeangliae TaxID=178035 RepID=A0A154PA90_DUFNO|nr:hypothetical protein WN55_10776 [Dufourea novaeangliae]
MHQLVGKQKDDCLNVRRVRNYLVISEPRTTTPARSACLLKKSMALIFVHD